MKDITGYDAVEVDPITIGGHLADGTPILERVEPDHPKIHMWCVYLHCVEGGVECIADCGLQEDAELIAEALRQAFPTLRG